MKHPTTTPLPWLLTAAAGSTLFLAALLLTSLPALAAAEVLADKNNEQSDEPYAAAYSYLRIVDGDATLLHNNDERDSAEANQPLLTGDRLFLSKRTRVEAILSDRTVVRLEGETQLGFDALGASPDATAEGTVLDLTQGEIQLTVPVDLLSELYPRIETGNSTIYIQAAGRYTVAARRNGDSELVVREGYAEVVSERGSTIVRADEEVVVEDREFARARLYDARSYTSLERWAERLVREAERFDGDDVDPTLRYSAATLNDHGTWLRVKGRRAWRPRVTAGWRPYHSGRWTYTPSGLTWVSSESWGWVPYHYGSWDYVGGHGWLWYPGHRYAPAWVYWHWGNSYASWCPTGYYNSYYGYQYANAGYAPVFRWGTYGWGAGHSRYYDRWNFVDYEHLGRRGQARFTRPGRELAAGRPDGLVEPGIITTDTRGLKPTTIRRPGQAVEVLRARPRDDGAAAGRLPDVTAFVTRQPLDDETEARVMARGKPRRDGGRVATLEQPTLTGTKPAPTGPGVQATPTPRPRRAGARTPRNAAGQAGEKPAVAAPSRRQDPSVRATTRERTRSSQPRASQPRTRQPSARQPSARQPSARQPSARQPQARPSNSGRKPASAPRATSRPTAKPPATEKPPARQEGARNRVDSQRAGVRQPSVRQPSVRQPSVHRRPRAAAPSASPRPSANKPGVRAGSSSKPKPPARVRASGAKPSRAQTPRAQPQRVQPPRVQAPRSQPRAAKPEAKRPPKARPQPRPSRATKPTASSRQGSGGRAPVARSGSSSQRRPSSAPRARSTGGSGSRSSEGGKATRGSRKEGDGSGGKP